MNNDTYHPNGKDETMAIKQPKHITFPNDMVVKLNNADGTLVGAWIGTTYHKHQDGTTQYRIAWAQSHDEAVARAQHIRASLS